MNELIDDIETWSRYPNHQIWHNKLWLSQQLDYKCGPAGATVPEKGEYIVRPIYNLLGMGLEAKFMFLEPSYKINQIPPGHFWCEKFEGHHYSADFEWAYHRDGSWKWKQINCWRGYNNPFLWRFTKWEKCDIIIDVPWFFYRLGWNWDMRYINVEAIDDKIIEVHLRRSPDPYEDYTVLIPIWKDDNKEKYINKGYEYIESYDDADGQLPIPRLGFCVK